MEFLYRLYSNDYFGIGLFIVITILAFSFLVILFFGKKDEKASNQEQQDNMINNIENNETATPIEPVNQNMESTSLGTMSLNSQNQPNETVAPTMEVPPVVEPVANMEPPTPVDNVMTSNPQASNNIPNNNVEVNNMPENINNMNMNSNIETPVNPVNKAPEENNFDPFTEIPKDIQDIKMPESIEVSEIKPEEPTSTFGQPVFDSPTESKDWSNDLFQSPLFDEPKNETNPTPTDIPRPKVEEPTPVTPIMEEESIPNDIFATPIDNSMKKPPLSNQFSSVYLSNENPEPIKEEVSPIPKKPDFELPKTLDMPKLNQAGEKKDNHSNIISPNLEAPNNENLDNIFGNLEDDSYIIDNH